MRLYYLFTLFISLLLVPFLTPEHTFAQSTPLSGSLRVTPSYPQPLEKVTIALESYSFDPTRAFIVWRANGKQVLAGTGETRLSIAAGQAGTQTTIQVTARTSSGNTYYDQLVLAPASVNILWEATDTYVPPFYEGKALPAEGADVRLIALPSFYSGDKYVDPHTVSYTWTFNDTLVHDSSGYAKNTYTTRLNYLENQNTAKVVATTADGSESAEARETLTPNAIVPRLYFSNNLTGTDYSHTVDERVEITKEASFTFEPYFISGRNLSSPNLSFSWTLNGLPTTPQSENTITIVPKEDSQGSGVLAIEIENTKKYLQKAVSTLSIVFDTTHNR